MSQAETPSGKGAADENFPVGSFLLPKHLRPHVATYYAFARAIDDIADNAALPTAEKLDRLDGFAAAIMGESSEPAFAKAHAMRASLLATGVTARHCLDLISAFRQDAVKNRYESWAELIDYCDRSASPVGRYLLDLHGENPAGYRYSDALCNALQVINHMQDCADDYAEMDRVYLPQEWMREAGAVTEELARPALTPGMRQVLDRAVQGTRGLLAEARRLPGVLASRRLALESAVIFRIADRLNERLSREDPIAARVALSKPAVLGCSALGIADVLLRRKG
ncbi:squalene synthase HpnC [Iodidimonas sp. SYSU 1G8]|uniref:squalene synthase HpnC n=1 Tax=Iodidimonas sp. SYSU 1G8 TaxID=3133967 RepID=UPI0031FEA676